MPELSRLGTAIALGRSWQRSNGSLLPLWEARQDRSNSAHGPWKAHVLHMHTYWAQRAPVPRLPAASGHERRGHTHRQRLWRLLCRRSRPVCPQVSAKRWAPPGAHRRIQQRPGACSWTPNAYIAGPFRAPVTGLERPVTLRHRPGADYVDWAPGAQSTPHSEGPGKALNTEEGALLGS